MAKHMSVIPLMAIRLATRPQGLCIRCGQRTGRDARAKYCLSCKDAIDIAEQAKSIADLNSRR
jgi:hypothetical protein